VNQDIKTLVLALLSEQVPASHKGTLLSETVELADAGLDSLSMMSFWVAFERAVPSPVDIGAVDFLSANTVGDVVRQASSVYARSSGST
jgi:aryl carrier-like protein